MEYIDFVHFNSMMQNHQCLDIPRILEHDSPELQKQRIYIAIMNTFKTKQEIAKNFDPSQLKINLELSSLRALIPHFLQSRNALFSKRLEFQSAVYNL